MDNAADTHKLQDSLWHGPAPVSELPTYSTQLCRHGQLMYIHIHMLTHVRLTTTYSGCSGFDGITHMVTETERCAATLAPRAMIDGRVCSQTCHTCRSQLAEASLQEKLPGGSVPCDTTMESSDARARCGCCGYHSRRLEIRMREMREIEGCRGTLHECIRDSLNLSINAGLSATTNSLPMVVMLILAHQLPTIGCDADPGSYPPTPVHTFLPFHT